MIMVATTASMHDLVPVITKHGPSTNVWSKTLLGQNIPWVSLDIGAAARPQIRGLKPAPWACTLKT
jgi:hypothetical protein